jgi:esterase/lipase
MRSAEPARPDQPAGSGKRFDKRLLLVLPALLLAVFLAGPRVAVEQPQQPISLPDDLDQYLRQSEARFDDITPGTEKTIIWAGEPHQQTPVAIVYLHGYSATRQETAPLSDHLAEHWGANLFYTRLSGHGRSGQAMAEPGAGDWLQDASEALAIGKRLGRQVIVIGTSTGATLATWLASQQADPQLLAVILISPNFAPAAAGAKVLGWPWAEYFVPLLGSEYQWTPRNAEQARYWSHRYPTRALLPMMALVNSVNDLPLEKIQTPILVIHSEDDQVVSPAAIVSAYERFGSPQKQRQVLKDSQDPSHHVLAGRILAAQDTPRVESLIRQFVEGLAPSH